MTDLSQSSIDASRHHDQVPPVLWQLELSHYNEKVRWALDYKRVPHIRRSLLPGPHIGTAEHLTGDTSTTPVLTLEGCSIGDSTRVIAAIEERWPQPALYPEDQARRCRALDLEDFFDEELGPHIRRAMYHELLPHPELLLPLFSHGQPLSERTLLQARFTALRASMRRSMDIRPETAAVSRAKVIAAMDRLEREIRRRRISGGRVLHRRRSHRRGAVLPGGVPPRVPLPNGRARRPAGFLARVPRLTRPPPRRPMGEQDLPPPPRAVRRADTG